ncbi:MAG: kelch repeat-containing protein, partial [Acidimicrobiales bacterium]
MRYHRGVGVGGADRPALGVAGSARRGRILRRVVSVLLGVAMVAAVLGVIPTAAGAGVVTPAATWTKQSPVTSPSARHGASMAYDPATGNMVLFGGGSGDLPPILSGDTWNWNGTTWAQQSPATSPPARFGASMAYDPATGNMVLFGGEG